MRNQLPNYLQYTKMYALVDSLNWTQINAQFSALRTEISVPSIIIAILEPLDKRQCAVHQVSVHGLVVVCLHLDNEATDRISKFYQFLSFACNHC